LRQVECAACRPANRVVHATVAGQANRSTALKGTAVLAVRAAVATNGGTRYGDSAAVYRTSKNSGPRPLLDSVAEPPSPGKPKKLLPPVPPIAVAEIVTWLRAVPLAWAFALPPLPPLKKQEFSTQALPPAPPLAVEETDALGTLITIAFEVALPPAPPEPEKKGGAAAPPAPPPPPVVVEVANPLPVLSAVLVAAVAVALPPAPPVPPGTGTSTGTAGTAGSTCRVRSVSRVVIRWRCRGCVSTWPTVSGWRSVNAGCAGCAKYGDCDCVRWRRISSKKQT
jgi:hypothetical protein